MRKPQAAQVVSEPEDGSSVFLRNVGEVVTDARRDSGKQQPTPPCVTPAVTVGRPVPSHTATNVKQENQIFALVAFGGAEWVTCPGCLC
jgi:hypothetical protein